METLGAINVMCFDKTGTLTQNKMTVAQISTVPDVFTVHGGQFYSNDEVIDPDNAHLQDLLRVAALCNDSIVKSSQNEILNGSSTENALLVAALAAGIDITDMRARYPLLKRTPRGDNRRYMVTEHHSPDGGIFIAVKGNPEEVTRAVRRSFTDDARLGQCRKCSIDGSRPARPGICARLW